MQKHVILAAGGSGTRMGTEENKIFLSVCGQSVLSRSIQLFDRLIDNMMIVCRKEDLSGIENIVSSSSVSFSIHITTGGPSRQSSVLNGLKALQASPDDIVLVHDAARCLTPRSVIQSVLESCIAHGSGVPGIPAVNTMKKSDDGQTISCTVDRAHLYEIQTPQGFRYNTLLEASLRAEKDHFSATDDASIAEYCGIPVFLTFGSRQNIKITEKEDLPIVNAILENKTLSHRIGMGYDVHQLAEGRKLLLCGVEIPWQKGLLGHSDADVALHALMDAMLGACALGDIGTHFPDTDPRFKGISSLELLKRTDTLLREEGFHVCNADITIVAQQPKILPYIREMTANISAALKLDPGRISVKATTTEKLGFEGRMEGISSYAVCTVSGK